MDPLTADYPWYTPYQFAGNKPIWAIDLDGLEELFYKEAFRKSEIGETVINRANNTTLFKEFESKLKSQNKINVYVVNFDSKISYYDGGYKDINISFEGHPQGESVTKGTVQFTRNRDEFNRLVSKDYAFRSAAKGIDEGLLNRTFDSGKGMLFIMVANPLIYPGSYSNSNKKDHNIFLKNAIRNSVNTYVHESWDHGLHYLLDPNYKNDFEKTLIDHFNYHGVKTLDSPSVEDFDKDPKKYRGTKFEKTIKEIDGKD